MQRILESDFEPIDPPNNVINLDELRESNDDRLTTGNLRPEQLTFDEIFKKVIFGEEVKLKILKVAEYNSLRASLLRRYRSYQEIQMVLSQDKAEYFQCSCKKISTAANGHPIRYEVAFKLAPLAEKKNGDLKKYEILKDL